MLIFLCFHFSYSDKGEQKKIKCDLIFLLINLFVYFNNFTNAGDVINKNLYDFRPPAKASSERALWRKSVRAVFLSEQSTPPAPWLM